MTAQILKVTQEKFDPAVLESAAKALREGGLVVFPKETTYGIAANFNDDATVRKLAEIKKEPPGQVPVIHIADRDNLSRWVARISPQAIRLMNRFWKGPLTIVFPSRTGGEIGVRYPNHDVALELIRRAGVPIVASSASLSGEPACVRGDDAVRLFKDRVACIIDRGETRYKTPSTVVRVTGPRIEIVREGAIARSLIEELDYHHVIFVCTGNTCRSPIAEAMARELMAKKYKVKPDELERVKGIRISSAGTGAMGGQDMSISSRQVLEEMSFHPHRHSSTPLSFSLVEEADQIYVMSHSHREQILDWVPEAAPKVKLLDPSGRDVDDPIWGDVEVYRDCAMHIRKCIEARLGEL
jgi:tRNA threonylcarbamoyl adenosine modification protein (Sua5/YciO/YrdC/YwlC family)